MHRPSVALLALSLCLLSSPTQADYIFRPSVDAAISIPTGDWTDTATVGLGALAGIEVGVKHLFLSTVRIGWIQGLPKKSNTFGIDMKTSASHLPKFLGVLWFPAYKILPAYVVLEAGYSWNVRTIHEATVTSNVRLDLNQAKFQVRST
jgi:hypothetical protein